MRTLPTATPAPVPRTSDAKKIATFYAILLGILAVTQLFTFDTFLELIASFGLPGGVAAAYFITALLVSVEVFALPFLLRMPLSRGFRWVSMVCGWLAAAIWVKLSVWLVWAEPPVDNVGLLGTLVSVMPGWWAVFVSVSLVILAAWASWGMWPAKKATKRKK